MRPQQLGAHSAHQLTGAVCTPSPLIPNRSSEQTTGCMVCSSQKIKGNQRLGCPEFLPLGLNQHPGNRSYPIRANGLTRVNTCPIVSPNLISPLYVEKYQKHHTYISSLLSYMCIRRGMMMIHVYMRTDEHVTVTWYSCSVSFCWCLWVGFGNKVMTVKQKQAGKNVFGSVFREQSHSLNNPAN